jgi:Fe-S oxidoreductase
MAAPNNPRFVTIMTDLGFRSNPNLHRAQKRPTQSADRSAETVDGVDQSFLYLVGSENIKDGRHVGLDFYDLLIEALIDPGIPRKQGFECDGDFTSTSCPDTQGVKA